MSATKWLSSCFLVIVTILFVPVAAISRMALERTYQEHWCEMFGGQVEHRLADATRVDCLTDSLAVEVDFANKWAEPVGQALHYANMTGKAPAVLLIMESPGDRKHLKKLCAITARKHPEIIVFVTGPASAPYQQQPCPPADVR